MKYGYARVSTAQQAAKYGLDVQKDQLREAGAERIYADAYTGTKASRPEWDKLLGELKADDELIPASTPSVLSLLKRIQVFSARCQPQYIVMCTSFSSIYRKPTFYRRMPKSALSPIDKGFSDCYPDMCGG